MMIEVTISSPVGRLLQSATFVFFLLPPWDQPFHLSICPFLLPFRPVVVMDWSLGFRCSMRLLSDGHRVFSTTGGRFVDAEGVLKDR